MLHCSPIASSLSSKSFIYGKDSSLLLKYQVFLWKFHLTWLFNPWISSSFRFISPSWCFIAKVSLSQFSNARWLSASSVSLSSSEVSWFKKYLLFNYAFFKYEKPEDYLHCHLYLSHCNVYRNGLFHHVVGFHVKDLSSPEQFRLEVQHEPKKLTLRQMVLNYVW